MNRFLKKYQILPVQLKASFWFLVCSFLQKGISVITTPIFTRLLSTQEYGSYNVYTSWQNILVIFITLNLFYGVYTKGLIKFETNRETFSSSMYGLVSALVVIWLIIYLPLHEWWNSFLDLRTAEVLMMILSIWATSIFSFWAAAQRFDYKYRKLVLLTIIVSIAKPALSIFLIRICEDKVLARIAGITIVELVSYVGLYFFQYKRNTTFYNKEYWCYALAFNIPLIPHYLSQSVLNSADRIMIKQMVSLEAAGIYGLAYSISMIMKLFNTALLQTINPWLYKKIKNNELQKIGNIAYLALMVIAVVNLVLIALAPEMVAIFAPRSYYEAIWVIPPVAMSVFFVFEYSLFADFEFYFEKTKSIMAASIIGAVLNIALNYIFIRIYGYYAAGYTTLFCYIVYALGHYYFMRQICNKELNGYRVYDPKIIFLISGGFVLIGFLLLLTYRLPLIRYIIVFSSIVALIIFRHKIKSILSQLIRLRKRP